jgi:hypothetical protein
MSKFDFIKAAALQPGKLIPFTFYVLPGEPRVLIEHLGPGNVTFENDQIARASVEEDKKKRKRKATRETFAENRAANRKMAADHVIRRLDDVTFPDGSKATDADLADFVAALPDDCITDVMIYACDKENWREAPASEPEALAKKS